MMNNTVDDISGYKCVQANLQRSKAAMVCINELITRRAVDIALIQEPYCKTNTISGISKSWRIFQAGRGRKRSAVIVANPNLDAILISECSDEDHVTLEIRDRLGFSFVVVSGYFDSNQDIQGNFRKLGKVLDRFRNTRVLIGIDSNARSTTWFDFKTNQRGRLLEDFIDEKGLLIMNNNDRTPSFETRRSKSWIDLTLCTAQLVRSVRNWGIGDEEITSDHNLIMFEITNAHQMYASQNEQSTRYKVREADWGKFRETLCRRVADMLDRSWDGDNGQL